MYRLSAKKNPKRKGQQTIENKSSFTLVLFQYMNIKNISISLLLLFSRLYNFQPSIQTLTIKYYTKAVLTTNENSVLCNELTIVKLQRTFSVSERRLL